ERIFEDDYEDGAIDVSGSTRFEEIEPEVTEEGNLNGGSVNCGICYRTQHLPPYKANNKHRMLFTSHDIVGVDRYLVNNTLAPHTIEAHASSSKGRVSFEMTVPKYF